MAGKSAEVQAREFVSELNTSASEYGFEKTESWEIRLVSEKEKLTLEKKYYPVVSALIAAESLPVILELVKTKLNQVTIDTDKPVTNNALQYLIGYNIKRTMS